MAQPPRPGIMRPPRFGVNFGNMGGRPINPGPQGPRPRAPQPGPQPRVPQPGGGGYRPNPGYYVPPDSDSDVAAEDLRRQQDLDADRRRLEYNLQRQAQQLREQEAQLLRRQQELDRRQQEFDARQATPPPTPPADENEQARDNSENNQHRGQRDHADFTREYFNNIRNRRDPSPRDRPQPRRAASVDSTATRNTVSSLADRFHVGMDLNREIPSPEYRLPMPIRRDGRIQILPPAQQHMKDMEKEVIEMGRKLQFDSLQVEVLDRTNTRLALGLDDRVAEARRLFEETENIHRIKKQEVVRAKALSQKFKVSVKQPIILPEPEDFERSWGLLTAKGIRQAIPAFNPGDPHPKDFHDVWNLVLQHGRGEYLQPEHYMKILGYVMQGEAGRTFTDLEESGYNLTYILETLAELYATKRTLIEDQRAVDDFIRSKGEALTTAMRRCNVMIQRLRPLYDEYEWPNQRERLLKGVLKQIITSKTRKYLDMKESTALEEGAHMDFQSLLSEAHLYERCHDELPKKETATTFQTASGQPKQCVLDQMENHSSQLQALKQEQMLSKNREKTLSEALQIASAILKKKPDQEKKKDALHKVLLQDRAASKERKGQSMTDVEMASLPVFKNMTPKPFSLPQSSTTSGNKDRADKKDPQRGRSQERRDRSARAPTPHHPGQRSQSRDSQRSRSNSQNRTGSSSRDRTKQTGSRSGSAHSDAGLPEQQVFVQIKGINYYVCHTCDYPHNIIVGDKCRKQSPKN